MQHRLCWIVYYWKWGSPFNDSRLVIKDRFRAFQRLSAYPSFWATQVSRCLYSYCRTGTLSLKLQKYIYDYMSVMIRAKIQSSLPISIFMTKITRLQSAEFSLRRYFESYSTPTVGRCIIYKILAIPSTVCFYKTFSAHIVCTSHLRADKRINQSLTIENLANHVTFSARKYKNLSISYLWHCDRLSSMSLTFSVCSYTWSFKYCSTTRAW